MEQSKGHALQDAKQAAQDHLHKILNEHKAQTAYETTQLEKCHRISLQKALVDAETKSNVLLKEKEVEHLDLLKQEKQELSQRIAAENKIKMREAVECEHDVAKTLRDSIEMLKAEHQTEMEQVAKLTREELRKCVEEVEAVATKRQEDHGRAVRQCL